MPVILQALKLMLVCCMKVSSINIRHWNSAYSDWTRALRFYKEETVILRHRLQDIASKNTWQDILSQVEHFENQFVLHTEAIEKLLHNIRQNVVAIGKEAENYVGFIDNKLSAQLSKLEDQYITEERLWLELRQSFHRFCAEWM